MINFKCIACSNFSGDKVVMVGWYLEEIFNIIRKDYKLIKKKTKI